MKWCQLLGVVLAVVMAAPPALAAGRLEVELRYPVQENGRRADAGDGRIEVVLTNTGNEAVEVLSSSVPTPFIRGKIASDLFVLEDEAGERPTYRGIWGHSDLSQAAHYTTIPPGKRHVELVNLAVNYEVAGGQSYAVTLRPVLFLPRPRSAYRASTNADLFAALMETSPATIHVVIDAAEARKARQVASRATVTASTSCTSGDFAEFEQARSIAAAMANSAAQHLAGLYGYEVDGAEVILIFTPSPRYTQWFGVHGNPNPMQPDDNYVNSMLVAIGARLSNAMPGGPAMTFTCECTPLMIENKWNAWVDPGTHYVVNACPRFVAAPLLPVVRDQTSKVGVLIHEASHFSDMLAAGTNDAPQSQLSYEATAAMAVSNRSAAVHNANNYKFFVLNHD